MEENTVLLGYLVYRRKHDDFLVKFVIKRDYKLSSWAPEPWRSTIFTKARAEYVAKLLRAEVCPLYDHGDKHVVIFDEEALGVWDDTDMSKDIAA